ncbi:hypothetical protein [Rhodovulum sulfidophilum]|uniref:Uncharacterized protein n=1 Tax=Rhodovulum sulfidophilum TaxID=35806 RepID=A0ABS1RU16_RHOSU|nr:hypothetical protein [Rhodovulum sulfidophilum]MBL3609572.1 hypothetical protein [Rhodovulum sulfidophilum]MCE8456243.1 hypothetical protein [Rhodovulum sulfidophilum]
MALIRAHAYHALKTAQQLALLMAVSLSLSPFRLLLSNGQYDWISTSGELRKR